jgi:MraZ protein
MKWYKKPSTKNHMLIGEFTHTIDDKKRISLPSKFRKEIGKKIVATYGLEQCLFLYTLKEWEKISEEIAKLGMMRSDTREFNRFMFGGAIEIEIDSLGRLLLPEYLRTFADLKEKCVFIGVHSRVEMWNERRWSDYKKKAVSKADSLAEKLSQTGAF